MLPALVGQNFPLLQHLNVADGRVPHLVPVLCIYSPNVEIRPSQQQRGGIGVVRAALFLPRAGLEFTRFQVDHEDLGRFVPDQHRRVNIWMMGRGREGRGGRQFRLNDERLGHNVLGRDREALEFRRGLRSAKLEREDAPVDAGDDHVLVLVVRAVDLKHARRERRFNEFPARVKGPLSCPLKAIKGVHAPFQGHKHHRTGGVSSL
jgi:hypothetical protein